MTRPRSRWESGEPRSTPLLYPTRGDDVVLVASKAGSPRNPA
jgi:F420H(2)-dependent quinone reductase